MTKTKDAKPGQAGKVRITVIIQNRYLLEKGVVTGRQIKELANIPAGFSLHRREQGGAESVGDDESVEVRNGDHFYAQPLIQAGVGHREAP